MTWWLWENFFYQLNIHAKVFIGKITCYTLKYSRKESRAGVELNKFGKILIIINT